MLHKHTPTFEIDGKKEFTGHVTVTLLKYKDRLKKLKEMNFSLVDGNKYEMASGQIDSIIKMVEIAEAHIVHVDLKRESDGQEYKSIEDLQYDMDGARILNEIASVIINGAQLGKT